MIHVAFPIILSALASSAITRPGVATEWYRAHNSPFTPPSWVFAVVWTLNYTLLIIFAGRSRRNFRLALAFALLGVLWCLCFFILRQPVVALFILVANMFSVFYISVQLRVGLLLPYGIWLCLAVALNAHFVALQSQRV